MPKEDILASVAVLVLAGVLVYMTKVGLLTIGGASAKRGRISANQAIDADGIVAAGGDPSDLLNGPSIYVSSLPWPFGANVGNVIPPNSAGVTLPGSVGADFLGFATT